MSIDDLPTPIEAILREELALAQAENVRLRGQLESTLSSLEVAHSTDAGRVRLQLYDTQEQLHTVKAQFRQCQTRLAIAENELRQYQSADTLHPPPNTDTLPDV